MRLKVSVILFYWQFLYLFGQYLIINALHETKVLELVAINSCKADVIKKFYYM